MLIFKPNYMEQQIRRSTNNPILCTKKRPHRGDGTFKIAINSKVRSHSVSVFVMAPIEERGVGLESL